MKIKIKHLKRCVALGCASALLLAMLAGCNNTAPKETPTPSPGDNSTPATSAESDPDASPYPKSYYAELDVPETEAVPIDLPSTDELILYLPPYSGFNLIPVIDLYEKMYPDVNIIIEDFYGTEADAYSERLSTELAVGKGPDILFPVHMYSADDYKTASSGAFLDLNEIIEKDKGFNLDDYVKPVLDGGVLRGKRYIMPYSYRVPVLISTSKQLDEIGFDMSQTGDTVSFMNEVMRCLPKARENPNFRTMFSSEVRGKLYYYTGVRIVDFETNTVLPDEEGLKKISEAYKPYFVIDDENNNFNSASEFSSHLQRGTFTFAHVQEANFFIWTAGQLKATDDYQITVIPGIDGKIHADGFDTVAINSSSQNQLNAWRFIKLLLSPEYQSNIYVLNYIPVRKDSIPVYFDKVQDYRDAVKDYEMSGIFVRLSDAEKQAYIDIITNVVDCQVYVPITTREMFREQIRYYLKDEISYEDAIARLRNQLTLYVSE